MQKVKNGVDWDQCHPYIYIMLSRNQDMEKWSLNTSRLVIRPAKANREDTDFLYGLWTNSEVMRFVGFPDGLRTSHAEIEAQLKGRHNSIYDRVLLACRQMEGNPIGECKLGSVNDKKTAETDVKLRIS
jgi:RimJ/RimL family protein N-acetyltransferase